ncbi:hypothetical protein [Achromobacter sp. NFACC18-2]|uniref:hypothetical protein n=1 Tax=Achromobacter sp. NFACC18-2 TaxID=1564112 RepID=UPI000B848C01|nr:hypothetical protein [Achromobacter sp. NFACC18-2]
MHSTLKAILLAHLLWLPACAIKAPAPAQARPEEAPMYAGGDRRAAAALRAGDEQQAVEATKMFGSPSAAAQAKIEQGYRLHRENQSGLAMRRFNQAWLLNPDNPEVYAGFAALLEDQRKVCQAMSMMDRAMSLNPPTFRGLYADAGRIAARCAAEDKTLPPEARIAATARSDEWYRKGEAVEPDKGYLYASWATAYYSRGQFGEAWAMVHKSRAAGGSPSADFVRMLRARMPEPASS